MSREDMEVMEVILEQVVKERLDEKELEELKEDVEEYKEVNHLISLP